MAPAFKQLGQTLRNRVNVIEVDQQAWPGVSSAYGVLGFPTLRMYNDGEVTEYRGSREHDDMYDWAVKVAKGEHVSIDMGWWENEVMY